MKELKWSHFVLNVGLMLALCGCAANIPAGSETAPEHMVSEDGVSVAEETVEAEKISETGTETRTEAEAETETETDIDTDTVRESETKNEPMSLEKSEPVKTMKFVDVFGEEYETVVRDDIPKHEYKNDCFIRNGQLLRYEDESFSSRPGIDVSRHQGRIDWSKVKEQGFEFAFIRIGYRGYGKEGSINLDQRFHENIKGAGEAGIDVGVYFFSQAIDEEEALEEAEFVIETLKGYELELPVVYDPESILDDVARTDDVSGEQFTKNTRVFCDSIREYGYEPMIYSNMLWEAFEFDLGQLTDIPVWYADYEEFPQTPYDFVFWQYSNEGQISGIDGDIDLDIQIVRK